MKKFAVLAVVSLLLPACGSAMRLSTPAPAGALGCALELGAKHGYSTVAGGTSDGYARMVRRGGMFGDVREVLSVTAAGSSLVVEVVRYDGVFERGPTGAMKEEAQEILSTCGGPTPGR